MKTIAIVEDSLIVRKLLSTLLRNAGYRVIECATEAEGMKLGSVDMAILDYLLPDGNGLNVAKALKQKNPSILLVLLTARQEKINPQEVEACGIKFYFQKPVEPAEILQVAKNYLG